MLNCEHTTSIKVLLLVVLMELKLFTPGGARTIKRFLLARLPELKLAHFSVSSQEDKDLVRSRTD